MHQSNTYAAEINDTPIVASFIAELSLPTELSEASEIEQCDIQGRCQQVIVNITKVCLDRGFLHNSFGEIGKSNIFRKAWEARTTLESSHSQSIDPLAVHRAASQPEEMVDLDPFYNVLNGEVSSPSGYHSASAERFRSHAATELQVRPPRPILSIILLSLSTPLISKILGAGTI